MLEAVAEGGECALKRLLVTARGSMNPYSKLKGMKIVLIDDDEWIRDSLSLFFEGEGCNLRALETAEEALETLQEHHYDIIIADYRLPGMDGLEFLRRMKQTHPRAMKILITAYKDEKVVSEARRLGLSDFIEKPSTTSTIEESLLRLLEGHKQDTLSPCDSFRTEQQKGLAHKLNAERRPKDEEGRGSNCRGQRRRY